MVGVAFFGSLSQNEILLLKHDIIFESVCVCGGHIGAPHTQFYILDLWFTYFADPDRKHTTTGNTQSKTEIMRGLTSSVTLGQNISFIPNKKTIWHIFQRDQKGIYESEDKRSRIWVREKRINYMRKMSW